MSAAARDEGAIVIAPGNVGAIDIGTNSVRLLITDRAGRELAREMQITRLGQGVDRTGSLHPDAIARTLAVLEAYGKQLRAHQVRVLRAAATSAARDASNRAAFFEPAAALLGHPLALLSGDEEAALSFRGATDGLSQQDAPFLVVDIGGGSTEFVLGSRAPEALISLDMGCVRMTERHLVSDPPAPAELDACRADVRTTLAEVHRAVPVDDARTLIGLAGTVTALAALKLGLQHYDAERTHGLVLTRDDVDELCNLLAAATIAQRRVMLAEPKRAEVIVGGAIVLQTMLHDLHRESLIVSERDILDGLAASCREATETR